MVLGFFSTRVSDEFVFLFDKHHSWPKSVPDPESLIFRKIKITASEKDKFFWEVFY
jgi:hypothetical protein